MPVSAEPVDATPVYATPVGRDSSEDDEESEQTPDAVPSGGQTGLARAADAARAVVPSAPARTEWLPSAPARTAWLPWAAAATVVLLLAGAGVWWTAEGPGVGGKRRGTAAATALAVAWPLVQEGDRFWPARTVQYLLVAQGHPVDVDSDFEQRTTAAVKAFQSEHGLEPDGKVGPLTWPLLVRPVDSRSEGADVRALQSLLTSAGLPTDITGRFTAATAHNLSSFQDTHHLPTTGQVDVRTWRVLLSAQAPPVRTVR